MYIIKSIISTYLLCLSLHLFSQDSLSTSIANLQAEIEYLENIRDSLQSKFESLRFLEQKMANETVLQYPKGYFLRFTAPALPHISGVWPITSSILNGNIVYSIRGFTDPHQTLTISQQLRTIDMSHYQIIFASSQPFNNTPQKISSKMSIED